MKQKEIFIVILGLLAIDLLVWIFIFSGFRKYEDFALYFLDVGQGDSQAIVLPRGVQILIDGGPGGQVLDKISKVLPKNDRRIEIVIATHPQLDHIGGLIDVLKTYKVGLLITSSRKNDLSAYTALISLATKKKIPIIALGEGDEIRYQGASLSILSPSSKLLINSEVNESSLVALLSAFGMKAVYTGDAGFEVEKYIQENYDLKADVLKVGHHGSRYATGEEFLAEIQPKISVIEVGENNYGHPTKETLERLRTNNSRIYTTKDQGTIKITSENGILKVYSDS